MRDGKEDSQVSSLEGIKKRIEKGILFFPGKACPEASQVPKPPSRHCGSEAVLAVEGEREGIT